MARPKGIQRSRLLDRLGTIISSFIELVYTALSLQKSTHAKQLYCELGRRYGATGCVPSSDLTKWAEEETPHQCRTRQNIGMCGIAKHKVNWDSHAVTLSAICRMSSQVVPLVYGRLWVLHILVLYGTSIPMHQTDLLTFTYVIIHVTHICIAIIAVHGCEVAMKNTHFLGHSYRWLWSIAIT